MVEFLHTLFLDRKLEFEGRSIYECFQYFVSFLESLIDQFVTICYCGFGSEWMIGSPHWLEKSKTAN